ncbi:MAG: replication protein P [Shewanella sp.]
MKDIQQMVNGFQAGGEPVKASNHAAPVSPEAERFINDVFIELKACFPAWRYALPTEAEEIAAKRSWMKAFYENGIRQVAQVKRGLIRARKSEVPHFPSVGVFIAWCKDIDTDSAFDRCISQRPALDEVERSTNGEVGYQCRTQLPADKARKLYKDTYMKWYARWESGELQERQSLPQFSSVDKMQNPDAVIRAGQIPAGKGFEAFKAMKKKLK